MPKDAEFLSRAAVLSVLPDYFQQARGRSIPDDLDGATIVDVGTPEQPEGGDGLRPEGGGLVIDYRPAGQGGVRRLALEFNECGMWVSYTGPRVGTIPA